jgi:tight adherence protein B
MDLLAALLVGLGLAVLVVALLRRARRRQDEMLEYLQLPFSEEDYDPQEVVERVGLLAPSIGAVDDVLGNMELGARISAKLEKARLPLRAGEYVMLAGASTLAVSLWTWMLTEQALMGLVVAVVLPLGFVFYLDRRIRKRKQAFEEQLPPTLSLIASSLRAGHTLLRSIDMMVEETPPPMSEEFERVLAETRLGLPMLDALDRMAERLEVPDFEWIVHAIRIQQSTGGKLADLLFTLADFMREREEVRREVRVLTAEGRFSALVLGALPFLVAIWLQISNPGYFAPMLSGGGLAMLFLAAMLMGIGTFIIIQMVKAVEL